MTNGLVSTDWLLAHLQDENLRVVDIRGRVLPADAPLPHYYAHRDDYLASHIPNAVFVDWTRDIVDPESRSQDVASPEAFGAFMGAVGISNAHFVVAYDDFGGIFSARLWWAMNYYGHQRVAVLDGGWKKWVSEGKPTESTLPIITPTTFEAVPQAGWRVTAQEVQARAEGVALVDVRTPEEYRGESSRAKRGGHIPSAVNVPRSALISADGTMPTPEALRTTFAQQGITLDTPQVMLYCNAGVSASYGLLALQAAGYRGGVVYDGSWKDWGNDDTKPIA
jgi:thiosulfate/3-mercaptopyruvate sulfurtransferase